jgi:DNA polymerase-3 subunit gamma/tau
MSFVSLYRKYRPQEFTDVRGQEHVTDVLASAIKSKSFPHAYLFAGSRGLGKTSAARIFARGIGTSERDTYEIDAASNRGIDDIRELREAVQALPFDSAYKVYIIDEAHMLTKEAFNALLKTLEEPPAHTIFILATTELEKLPETVVSRCEVHYFRQPTLALLQKTVQSVAQAEGYQFDDDAAELVSRLGDGSFRDTLGVLQKVTTATTDKSITRADVERIAGVPSGLVVNEIIGAIAAADAPKALEALHQLAEKNVDMKLFTTLLVERLRAILLLRFAPKLATDISRGYSDVDLEFLKDMASGAKEKINSQTLARLLLVFPQIPTSTVPELPLELALLDIIGDNA